MPAVAVRPRQAIDHAKQTEEPARQSDGARNERDDALHGLILGDRRGRGEARCNAVAGHNIRGDRP